MMMNKGSLMIAEKKEEVGFDRHISSRRRGHNDSEVPVPAESVAVEKSLHDEKEEQPLEKK